MRRPACSALLAAIIAAAASDASAGAALATDANLVTALDVSDSIMRHEEWIEFAGMARAIESAGFIDAVAAGTHGRIGFAVIAWSSGASPDVVVPWTLIATPQDARAVAAALRAAQHRYGFATRMRLPDRPEAEPPPRQERRTDLSAALGFAADLLRAAPFEATREVINICGNGVDNVEAGPALARARALAAGMVINGLVIGADKPGVADYYRAQVQGGDGSFVLEVGAPREIAAALLEKFRRDLKVARPAGEPAPPET